MKITRDELAGVLEDVDANPGTRLEIDVTPDVMFHVIATIDGIEFSPTFRFAVAAVQQPDEWRRWRDQAVAHLRAYADHLERMPAGDGR